MEKPRNPFITVAFLLAVLVVGVLASRLTFDFFDLRNGKRAFQTKVFAINDDIAKRKLIPALRTANPLLTKDDYHQLFKTYLDSGLTDVLLCLERKIGDIIKVHIQREDETPQSIKRRENILERIYEIHKLSVLEFIDKAESADSLEDIQRLEQELEKRKTDILFFLGHRNLQSAGERR